MFDGLWPDTNPASDGMHPLSRRDYRDMKKGLKIYDNARFLLHLLNFHEGEARITMDRGYQALPDGIDHHEACFWHYQYVRNLRVRKWLHARWKAKDQGKLTDDDIKWILCEEQDANDEHLPRDVFQTMLLRYVPFDYPPLRATEEPLARLNEGRWEIRQGNYITLAELFNFGQKHLTCFQLYQMLLTLPIFIHRREHPESTKPEAVMMKNAKNLHHAENGSWALPKEGRAWERRPKEWKKGGTKW